MDLDLNYVRSQFPVFATSTNTEAFFENAGGSYACQQTITALNEYYVNTKVQPYADYAASASAGKAMDHSRQRWADALGVGFSEVQFGPSTSINTYVLANAFRATLKPGDEVVVTNQDHEANTGALRRAVAEAGATVREWRIDPETGLLDPAVLAGLVGDKTRVVSFPHCSNIVGQENDVKALTSIAHAVGARVIVDGVSYAPHGFPDLADLGPDVYVFSLYKTYSVHQGLMVVRQGLLDELPNQGHFFNEGLPTKRLTPAGPDHAQEAAAGGVLDYVENLAAHHGVAGSTLGDSVATVGHLWRAAEDRLAQPLLSWLADHPKVRLIGPSQPSGSLHRAPTIAFSPSGQIASELVAKLVGLGIQISSGNFYAYRVLEGLGIDPEQGVVRASMVHYTSEADVSLLIASLDRALA